MAKRWEGHGLRSCHWGDPFWLNSTSTFLHWCSWGSQQYNDFHSISATLLTHWKSIFFLGSLQTLLCKKIYYVSSGKSILIENPGWTLRPLAWSWNFCRFISHSFSKKQKQKQKQKHHNPWAPTVAYINFTTSLSTWFMLTRSTPTRSTSVKVFIVIRQS